MAPRIFITGVTGYIGGDVLHELYSSHPDYEYVALVRTEERGKQVQKAFPNVQTVYGDLDKSQLIEDESAKADIVIHTADASDHEGAAKAIAKGLFSGHNSGRVGYWLHTGGSGILTYEDSDAKRYGEASDKIYDDLDGVKEVTTLPDHAFHRNVDKIVLEAGAKQPDAVKTALLCPPTIYGSGRGPANCRSRQLPVLAHATLENRKAPVVGRGLTWWNNVHVADLSRLFALLVDAAIKNDKNPELWGERGYYFVEASEHQWGKLSKQMGEVAAKRGYIPTSETESMPVDKAQELGGFEAVSWGLNSRCKARRARELLGWKPTEHSVEEEIPQLVEREYQDMQKQK